MVKNPPCNARDTGSTPGLGRFHMLWSSWACGPQLKSSCSGAHELQLLKSMRLEPVLHNRRSHHSEKPAHRNRRVVQLTATRESPVPQPRTNTAKNELNLNKVSVGWGITVLFQMTALQGKLVKMDQKAHTHTIPSNCLHQEDPWSHHPHQTKWESQVTGA